MLGDGSSNDVQECWLVVGIGQDSHSHLAKTDATLNGFKHAEYAANERGLRARVFRDEDAAVEWLVQADLH